jgi:hypothetical protein
MERGRPLLKRTVCAVFLVMLFYCASAAASYIAVAEPDLHGAHVVVADLFGQGEQNLLVGKDHSVYLLEEGELRLVIDELSGRVTALAVGDVTGDFRNDLAVSTDRGGALYLFTERDGVWERHGHAQYLWDTIHRLGIHDFNNDGWGDLVALTDKGEAYVYLSFEGSLYPLWKSPPGELVVGVEVLDIDADGFPDLIYALRSGYVAVMTWHEEEFAAIWENYPWGAVESLVALPNSASPEWLVVTSQKMLYSWRWRGDGVEANRQFEANGLGEHLIYVPQEGLLSISMVTGISLFELQSSQVVEKWRVPGLFGQDPFYYRGEFYFRDSTDTYLRLVEGSLQWRLFVYDTEVTSSVDYMSHNGQLYFSLLDLAEVLGMEVHFENGWRVTSGTTEIALPPSSTQVGWRDLLIPLATALVEEEGAPFVPSEVLTLLGWNVKWDLLRQQVVLVRNWGWWL